MTTKRRYDSLDFLKGLACIAVVLIHFNFPGDLGIAVKTYCRFAVPIFFFVSGFFVLTNGQVEDGSINRKLRRTFWLTMGSACFYAVFTVVWRRLLNPSWDMLLFMVNELDAGSIVKFIITNDPFVYSHLWFLLALFYCYLTMMLVFHKQKRLKWIAILAPVLLVGYSCLQEFGGVWGIHRSLQIVGTTKRVYLFNLYIFRALPMFFFGILARQHVGALEKMPVPGWLLLVMAALGGGLSIFERFSLGEETQYYIGSIITAACLVLWAVKTPGGGFGPLTYIGRELSMYVYILHIAVGNVVDAMGGKLNLRGTPVMSYGKGLMVLVGSLCAAFVIVQAQKKLKRASRKKAA